MKISQLLQELSYSEFRNLSVGEEGAGEIKEERIPSIISAVNGALLRLYSKFLFNHRTLVLKKLDGQTSYKLLKTSAESGNAAEPFILDADDPFTDDILKIEGIVYQDESVARRVKGQINVQVPITVFLPSDAPAGTLFLVRYRAAHPVVVYEDDTDIDVPPSAFEAIKAYVAYKEYAAINTETGINKGQEYLGLFNQICAELVDRDTIGITEDFSDNRFHDRGYV